MGLHAGDEKHEHKIKSNGKSPILSETILRSYAEQALAAQIRKPFCTCHGASDHKRGAAFSGTAT